jgi:hypothetical protein
MNLKILRLKKSQITIKKTEKIFYFVTKNIKNSIFSVFGHVYFLELLKINYKNCFYIKKSNKIIGYVSYIDIKNESKMKKILIRFILKNFFKSIYLLILNFNFFFKMHTYPKKFIQLIHLVIKIEKKNNSIKKLLHKKINKLHKKILLPNYKGIYAMYENNNIIASKFYKKNNFKVFKSNFFYTFVKKEF